MQRMWINQPSTSQPYHEYHGQRVLVDFDDRNSPMVYFLSGDTLAMQMDRLALSRGWPRGTGIDDNPATAPALQQLKQRHRPPYRVSGDYIIGPHTSKDGVFGGTVPDTWAANFNAAYAEGQKSLASLLRTAQSLLRPLDCGVHACRYCEAVSPDWKHAPTCAYHNNIKAINAITNRIDDALREVTCDLFG